MVRYKSDNAANTSFAKICCIVKENTVYALLISVSSAAFANFGDVMEVNGASKIPDGWVLTRIDGPTLMAFGKGPKLSPRAYAYSIMDVRGAEKGAEIQVLGNSPVPSGWVITKVDAPIMLSSGRSVEMDDSAITYTIKYLEESIRVH